MISDRAAMKMASSIWGLSARVQITYMGFPPQKTCEIGQQSMFNSFMSRGKGATWEDAFADAYKRYPAMLKPTLLPEEETDTKRECLVTLLDDKGNVVDTLELPAIDSDDALLVAQDWASKSGKNFISTQPTFTDTIKPDVLKVDVSPVSIDTQLKP